MTSIYTGVSGMQANQRAIDVIANNVANLNTVGYKGSRVSFEEALVTTQVQGLATGTNPVQTGMGVAVASIDVNMNQGNLRSTGRTLDVAMVGDGYFVIQDGASHQYTRDGIFQLDGNNNLVMARSGQPVMGWIADAAGNVNTAVPPTAGLNFVIGSGVDPVVTSTATVSGTLDASTAAGNTVTTQFTAYDSLGTAHEVTMVFRKTATTADWDWTATMDGASVTGSVTDTASGGDGTLDVTNLNLALTPTNGAAAMNIAVDVSGLTVGSGPETAVTTADGSKGSKLLDFGIDAEGKVVGAYSDGTSRTLAQLAVAHFDNAAGLTRDGNSMYSVSANSGAMTMGTAAELGNKIRSGFLEESNVDLTNEFAGMIIAQRGFQANSRAITAGDEMLQDILQIKR